MGGPQKSITWLLISGMTVSVTRGDRNHGIGTNRSKNRNPSCPATAVVSLLIDSILTTLGQLCRSLITITTAAPSPDANRPPIELNKNVDPPLHKPLLNISTYRQSGFSTSPASSNTILETNTT
ncbi:hypothetical protein DFH07DRAFT_45284 [Mycena maculata]|uniref:Uncharacterized protein n=1 Tax=Mycena maculata TaxID=230809 RepID=A0AAD7NVA2_9AGAR|nr:hypothetical protein DFH07DRAFT_45284 [Mycena maculata]